MLLEALAGIEGLRWLRFLYAYPNRVTNRLLETIAKHDNICKYLDVPLQHASPDVLKRMKRGAGADIFLKTLEKVRSKVPGIVLRTSFIVGFPGESPATLMYWKSLLKKRSLIGLGFSTIRMKKVLPPFRLTLRFQNAVLKHANAG